MKNRGIPCEIGRIFTRKNGAIAINGNLPVIDRFAAGRLQIM